MAHARNEGGPSLLKQLGGVLLLTTATLAPVLTLALVSTLVGRIA